MHWYVGPLRCIIPFHFGAVSERFQSSLEQFQVNNPSDIAAGGRGKERVKSEEYQCNIRAAFNPSSSATPEQYQSTFVGGFRATLSEQLKSIEGNGN